MKILEKIAEMILRKILKMDKEKLNHVVTFMQHHEAYLTLLDKSYTVNYCKKQSCVNCVHGLVVCADTYLNYKEILFLELNYPEYFI